MRTGLFLWIFCLLFVPELVSAQEYSYSHYDIADGLPSSTVYSITQDKDGFIWVATEAGVSRFDGEHFRTFTAEDGLNDIEVLQLFGDSRGRVWMAPFRGSVCYFFQGKIHNQQNDSLLAAIRITRGIENFAEDAQGNLLIQEDTALTLIRTDGKILRFDSAGGAPISRSVGCSRNLDGGFTVQIDQTLYDLSDSGLIRKTPIRFPFVHALYIALSPSWAVYRAGVYNTRISDIKTGREANYPFYNSGYMVTTHTSYSILDDSLLFINQYSGSLKYDMRTGVAGQVFLPGRRVSRAFRDQAGNIWFTTIGDGIYRLNSLELKTIVLPRSNIGLTAVHAIAVNHSGDELLVGDNHNVLFRLRLPDLKLIEGRPINHYGANRIIFIHQFSDGKYLIASDASIAIVNSRSGSAPWLIGGIKSASIVDSNRILVGGPWGAAILRVRKKNVIDTVWKERITAVFHRGDTNYIGTLHGLWRLIGRQPAQFLGDSAAFFRNRIAALDESPAGVLWVASYDDAVIGFRGGRIVSSISRTNGLQGNICHSIFYHDSVLWVGTDKGLDRVEVERPGIPVSYFAASDGLASNVVNVVTAIGATIYVGTSAGLTYFDERNVRLGDECRLNLTEVISSGHNRIADTAGLTLPVKDNNIRFDFAAISYRSVGDIRYRYRLLGLDTAWRETRDSYLSYPTLPSGKYDFQLQAINRFGRTSAIKRVPFVVDRPYWDRSWFIGLCVAVFLGLTWLLAGWRIRTIRRQQEQRAMQSRRMAELEHIALQSQMNPHFIFNCLNSIQQFVFDKDILATNAYISGFARLIRATLNHSSKSFISVTEEVEYLSDYLSLEKMRFKNNMEYVIEIGPEVDTRGELLPPMLLQPYVENSIRHGLRHLTNGQGLIRVSFHRIEDRLVVTIRDNGIGRKKATEFKTREHIEYQSKGMSLTSARIQMIGALYNNEIRVNVEDLTDNVGRPAGTEVVISFPIP